MSLELPGFADPVSDAQSVFRTVLDALSRPGTIGSVSAPARPPAPLGRAAAAVLLTLADNETPLFLHPAAAAAAPWIAFHCGAPAAPMERAAFALLPAAPEDADAWTAFPAGTDEAPEDGATVILEVAALGEGPAFTLEGPGLQHPAPFRAALPPGFAAAWARNRARFPRGFDLVLCCGDRLAALPRTVRVEEHA